MSKKAFFTVAVVSVLSIGFVIATNDYSQIQTPALNTKPSPLVQEIAYTFHINTSAVQAVFDQHHFKMQMTRETDTEQ